MRLLFEVRFRVRETFFVLPLTEIVHCRCRKTRLAHEHWLRLRPDDNSLERFLSRYLFVLDFFFIARLRERRKGRDRTATLISPPRRAQGWIEKTSTDTGGPDSRKLADSARRAGGENCTIRGRRPLISRSILDCTRETRVIGNRVRRKDDSSFVKKNKRNCDLFVFFRLFCYFFPPWIATIRCTRCELQRACAARPRIRTNVFRIIR